MVLPSAKNSKSCSKLCPGLAKGHGFGAPVVMCRFNHEWCQEIVQAGQSVSKGENVPAELYILLSSLAKI